MDVHSAIEGFPLSASTSTFWYKFSLSFHFQRAFPVLYRATTAREVRCPARRCSMNEIAFGLPTPAGVKDHMPVIYNRCFLVTSEPPKTHHRNPCSRAEAVKVASDVPPVSRDRSYHERKLAPVHRFDRFVCA